MSKLTLAGALLLTVLLSACSEEVLQPPLTGSDHESSIVLSQGETFDVRLNSNASTGYSWHILEIGDNLQLVTSEYRSDDVPPDLDGAGGYDLLTFEAVAAGTNDLVLHYKRSWEDDSTAARHWQISVTVE